MAFTVKSLYPSETVEDVLTAILDILALRSFEYIFSTLLTSSGRKQVSTARFALGIAADQAFNPVNYFAWAKGKPDFGRESPSDEKGGKPIPLPRATIAILIAALTLILEAAFLYGSLTESIPLTNKQLKLAVRLVNEPQGTKSKINTCAPIQLNTGRAKLTAIFALCNLQSGPRRLSGNITTRLLQTKHSLGFELKGSNGTATSVTSFALLLPGHPNNLVVQLDGVLQSNSTRALHSYYKSQKCEFRYEDDIGGQLLRNCASELDVARMVKLIVDFVKVEQGNDVPVGQFGTPNDYYIDEEGGEIVVGEIERQKITAIAVLVISLALFAGANICYMVVKNDNVEVIAALLREKTGQDFFTPAVSMTDKTIAIVSETSGSSGEIMYNIAHVQELTNRTKISRV